MFVFIVRKIYLANIFDNFSIYKMIEYMYLIYTTCSNDVAPLFNNDYESATVSLFEGVHTQPG